jgi:long-chain acyl-CoA synthetase
MSLRSEIANLGSLPRARGEWAPRTALIDHSSNSRPWTFLALDDAANAAAARLSASADLHGKRVAIISDNSATFLILYLGILRAGCIAVPVNHRLTAETIGYVLRDCDASLVLSQASHAAQLGLSKWSDAEEFVQQSSAQWSGSDPFEPKRPADDVAEILYTSGSTGRPKGVVLTHAGQLWALEALARSGATADERTIIAAPLYHMNGLVFSIFALRSGIEFVLMPRFEARAYIQAVAEHRCTMLSGIPTMLALVARHQDLLAVLDLNSVRAITIGSAPLTGALFERICTMFPQAKVSNGYGTTEAGPAIFGMHPAGLPRPPLSVGYPLKGVECRLVGGSSSDEGVFEVRTPAAFKEYLNLTSETSRRKNDGWCVTGDILRRDASGFYYFVGRDDDMFVCGGENVFPGDIEKLLERHPSVLQAAVVPVSDSIKGHIPIAFVVGPPGVQIVPEEIKAYCLRHGPAYAHPRAIIVLERLPIAGTHKVEKRALLAQAEEAARGLDR